MNTRHLTIMTIDDHRAAAREWAAVHRGVAELENIIHFGRRVPDRLHANVKRAHRDLDRIRREMQEVQACTLPGDHECDDCWRKIALIQAPAVVRRTTMVLTIGQHITGARALGAAKLPIRRLLEIVSDRKHLPVRVLDLGLRVERLIHAVRCAMDDVQYATLRGHDGLVDCWLGHFNYFDGDEVVNTDQNKAVLKVCK